MQIKISHESVTLSPTALQSIFTMTAAEGGRLCKNGLLEGLEAGKEKWQPEPFPQRSASTDSVECAGPEYPWALHRHAWDGPGGLHSRERPRVN